MAVAVGCEMNVLSELAETFSWTPTSFVVEKNTGLTKLKICFLTKPPSQSIQKKKPPSQHPCPQGWKDGNTLRMKSTSSQVASDGGKLDQWISHWTTGALFLESFFFAILQLEPLWCCLYHPWEEGQVMELPWTNVLFKLADMKDRMELAIVWQE